MKFLLLFSLLILTACTSQKEQAAKTKAAMDTWIGATKQQLIMQQGLPLKTESDGANGEVLLFGKQFSFTSPTIRTVWIYKLFFINPAGKVYHWLVQKSEVPPQQFNVTLFIR